MWHWHTVEHFSALKRHEVRSCDHINEAWKHYPRWNKPNTKEQILYESTYRTHLEQAKRREAKGKIGQTSQWRRGRRERSYCLTNSYKTNKNTFCFPHCLLITPLSELLKGLFVLFGGGGGLFIGVFLAVPRGLWNLNSPTRDWTPGHSSENAKF